MVDKTLASFHQDINRSAKEINASVTQLLLARAAMTDAAAGKPVTMRVTQSDSGYQTVEPPKTQALPTQPVRRNGLLAEPVRENRGGFIELKAQ